MVFDTHEQERIRRIFDTVVSDVSPAPDLEMLTERRHVVRAQPRPAKVRRPGFVVAIALGAVTLMIGTVAFLTLGDGSQRDSVINGDNRDAAGAGQSGFPRLVVDFTRLENQFPLRHVQDEVALTTETVSPNLLQTFGEPDSGPTAGRIWLVTDPDGSDFFRGEAYLQPGWQSVAVSMGQAFTKVGPLGSSVMWDTENDPDGFVIRAHALNVEPSALVEIVSGLREDSGWEPQFLPRGFVELYSGPDRAALGERRVVLIWSSLTEEMGGEITLWLLDSGPDGLERDLYSMLGPDMSSVESITETEVRGQPATRIDSQTGTIYQWMETPTVVARLLVQGGVDPDQVLDALIEVDQATWDETLQTTGPVDNELTGMQAQTFTGEGDPPEDVRALLRPGDLDLMAWGRAAGEPWALVTWELIEEGEPTLTCTDVLPLEGEGYCATPEGAGADGLFTPRAFVLGDGGLIVIHAAFGVDQVSFVSPNGSQIIKIHGEADGHPPTGVLPTSGHTAEGTLTALDVNGNRVGEPRAFSFTESEFNETPLPA